MAQMDILYLPNLMHVNYIWCHVNQLSWMDLSRKRIFPYFVILTWEGNVNSVKHHWLSYHPLKWLLSGISPFEELQYMQIKLDYIFTTAKNKSKWPHHQGRYVR